MSIEFSFSNQIAAPDYGKGPVVFEIEDNGLFHRKGIELQFRKTSFFSLSLSLN
jgi:hypothetical protein